MTARRSIPEGDAEQRGGMQSNPQSTPNPDPTQRTKEDLQREIASLKEFYDAKFTAYDKAIELLQHQADRSPSIAEIAERIKSLETLFTEKFKGVSIQFAERDTRTEQTFSQSQIALNAALSTAKEAVEKQNASSALAIAKSEAATAKQIEQIVVTFGETTKGLTDKIEAGNKGTTDRIDAMAAGYNERIEAVKDRLVKLERETSGYGRQKEGSTNTWGIIGGLIGAFGIIIGIVFTIMSFVTTK